MAAAIASTTTTISRAPAGGAGASAAAGGAGASAASGARGSLADFNEQLGPAISAYYTSHPDLVAKSAPVDEVGKCALFALSELRASSLSDDIPKIYKRRKIAELPRSIIVEKTKTSYKICVFAKGMLGKGTFKRVKDLLCIEYSLSTGEITISNKALSIRLADTVSKLPAERELYTKDAIYKAEREGRRYGWVSECPSFMTVEAKRLQRTTISKIAPGETALKIYTLHPRAALGDLMTYVLSESSKASSADLLLEVIQASYAAAFGIEQLHTGKHKAVYADYKPENLFGFADHSWRLGDVESIVKVDDYLSTPYNIHTASPLYIPPECIDYVLHNTCRTPAAPIPAAPPIPTAQDVWAMGMSILMMAIAIGHKKEVDASKELESVLLGIVPGTAYETAILRLKALKKADIDRLITHAITKQPRLDALAPALQGMLNIDPEERIAMTTVCEELQKFATSLGSGK